MSTIISKTVRQDGTGDYTNITTAVNDMLISGVAAAGDITSYLLDVDGGSYSGTISGFIPFSGTFNIIGSGTYFCLVSGISTMTGTYATSYTPNLNIENFTINCSGLPTHLFTVPSGFGLRLKNVQLLNNISGILNSGIVQLDEVESCGISGTSTYFINGASGELVSLINSSISNYGTGVYSNNVYIDNSNIYENYVAVYYGNSFNINTINSLFYGNISDINVGSGNLYLNNSTFNSPIYINNTYILADRIISASPLINISGLAQTGSSVTYSCLYPGSTLHPNISGGYNINLDPKFNDASNRDYRLQFKQTTGSPCVEVKLNSNIDSSISFNLDTSKLRLYDNQGAININEFLKYIYTQDDTLVFTDISNEISFAEKMDLFNQLKFELFVDLLFEESNVLTSESFNSNSNLADSFPWDWNETNVSTTEILKYNTYIVPRSIVKIDDIINSKIGILPTNISYKEIVKDNIKVYNKSDFRGVSYDYNQSVPGQTVIWLIDGTNQSLVKQDVYTGEELGYYPLLCNQSRSMIRPSGLIYTGVRGDYYTFIKQDDPNIELLGLTELGDFYWIPVTINTKFDLRGIKNFKDNLFITASQYPIDITNRTIVPSGEPLGKLLQYNSNDKFFNYIKSPELADGPRIYDLASGNYYPTDITVYEDGTLFIADYLSTSGIYKYDLAFDYALISTSYDNLTRVLLREQYDNVEI